MSQLDAVLAQIDADLDAVARAAVRLPAHPLDLDRSGLCGRLPARGGWLAADLTALGFERAAAADGGHPVVLGHAPKPRQRRTCCSTAITTCSRSIRWTLWDTPPFEPRLATAPDGRKVIVARGACDDKGQVMTFLEACRAWKAVTGSLPLGITMLVEGAEEDGSKNLPEFVEAHQRRARRPTSCWSATPACGTATRPRSPRRCAAWSTRRSSCAAPTATCIPACSAARAQNPIRVLARIIADLHDADGRVTLPGFYDGVPETPTQVLEQWRALGLTPEDFLGQVGLRIPAGEKGRMLIEQIQSRPTCDVNGIIGGYTGEGTKTVIAGAGHRPRSPSASSATRTRRRSATALRGLRARAHPGRLLGRVHPPQGLARHPAALRHAGARPPRRPRSRTSGARRPSRWARGGSIPIVGDFKRTLGLDTLLVGFGLDDDRVHSPNEKYDLKSFHKGTRTWARILRRWRGMPSPREPPPLPACGERVSAFGRNKRSEAKRG